jgi:NADH:ubiquinone oxidoreductase subunit 6 (subunit J)
MIGINNLYLIILLSLILTNYILYFSLNIVYSMLALLLSFFLTFILLILLNIEFLALLFIIIYMGAVAIIFLFIIMMMEIKFDKRISLKSTILIASSIFLYFILYNIIFQKSSSTSILAFITENFDKNNINSIIYNDIYIFSQCLYNYHYVYVLLAGFLLLLALIGALILTQTFNYQVNTNINKKHPTTKIISKSSYLYQYN